MEARKEEGKGKGRKREEGRKKIEGKREGRTRKVGKRKEGMEGRKEEEGRKGVMEGRKIDREIEKLGRRGSQHKSKKEMDEGNEEK